MVDILTKNNIGYALWNFRGDFGILDSGREDINYTDWYGHKLDSKLAGIAEKHIEIHYRTAECKGCKATEVAQRKNRVHKK